MTLRRPVAIAAFVTLLLVTACGRSDGDEFIVGPDGVAPSPPPTPGPRDVARQTAETASTPSAAARWRLGDAGEIEISVDNRVLHLGAVRPGEGWRVTSQSADGDEIEVTLERADGTWDVEVEIDDGFLDVEIEHERQRAEPGTVQVGVPGLADAGTVEIARSGGRLSLNDISLHDGWSHVVDETSRDTVKITFRRDDAVWELEAKRSGRHIDLKLDLEMRSPLPG